MDCERLLNRFIKYVKIHSTAIDGAGCYPSSSGQWKLGKLLVAELREIGIADVEQDEYGLVWATLPANVEREVPVVAFNAHLDTSPETSGENVQPQVIRNYSGGDLLLPGDTKQVIRVADNPELESLHGGTLITTDGTTLLGADDKAGIAAILEMASHLVEHPELEHGTIRLLFTCDEEIGHGADHVDLDKLGATAAYTLDGQGADEIDVETFSADLATITVRGVNIHPAIAKDHMVNAIRAAGEFVAALPRDTLSPETTDERNGFLHPYTVEGGVARVTLKILLRDFDVSALAKQADLCASWPHKLNRSSRVRASPSTSRNNIATWPRAWRVNRAPSYMPNKPSPSRPHVPPNDRSWWYRRVAAYGTRSAHTQSLDRATPSALAAGMGKPGRDGSGCRSAG